MIRKILMCLDIVAMSNCYKEISKSLFSVSALVTVTDELALSGIHVLGHGSTVPDAVQIQAGV